jgi:uncharacterized protein (DUF433 family)
MHSYKYIISDKNILGGKPVIKGTRISVDLILEWIAGGATIDKIAESYPHLDKEGIREAILYAKDSLKNEIFI